MLYWPKIISSFSIEEKVWKTSPGNSDIMSFCVFYNYIMSFPGLNNSGVVVTIKGNDKDIVADLWQFIVEVTKFGIRIWGGIRLDGSLGRWCICGFAGLGTSCYGSQALLGLLKGFKRVIAGGFVTFFFVRVEHQQAVDLRVAWTNQAYIGKAIK